MNIYPNPTSDILNIKTASEIDSIEIYDLLGKRVKTFTESNINNNTIDISQLSKGMYLAKISSDGKTSTYRIVKE